MKKKKILLGVSLLAATLVTASCQGSIDVNTSKNDNTSTEQTVPTTTNNDPVTQGSTTTDQTEKEFSVIWKNYNDELIKADTLSEGDSIVSPAAPTREATQEFTYTFDGWYTSKTGGEKVTNFGSANANVTYYARFIETKNEYTYIFFDDDGITELKKETLEYGSTIVAPKNPTKDATVEFTYEFDGWYTEKTGGDKVTDFGTLSGDVKLYARYKETKQQYTYTFYREDGTTVIKEGKADFGTSAEMVADPSKDGFTFVGWYTEKEAGERVTDFNVLGNVSYYARFISNDVEFTYTFYAEDGTTVLSTDSLKVGSAIPVPTAPTKDATVEYTYTFDGWYTAKTGGVKVEDFDKIIENSSYYARFIETKQQYTYIFYASDCVTEIKKKTVDYGTAIEAPADPTKDPDDTYYYVFTGWVDKDFNEVTLGNVTGNVEFYAAFSVYQKPVISFVVNEGSQTFTSIKIIPGEKVTLPTVNEISGYRFDGWYMDAEYTTKYTNQEIKNHITLYGKYVEQITVTFTANGETFKTIPSDKNGKITEPSEKPTKNGYMFSYWEYEGAEFDFNTEVSSNIELIAVFEEALETEFVGYGTGYTAFSTIASSFTGKDSKSRPQLQSDLTVGNFIFRTKAVLDSSNTVLNTQGTAIDINLTTRSSITFSGTWGSGDAGKVYIYKVDGSTETLVYTSSSSYESKGAVNISLPSLSLAPGLYRIKGLKDKDSTGASLALTKIAYEVIIEKVDVNFYGNNGQSIDSLKVRKGGKLSELPTLNDKSGYKFAGWYTTSTFDAGTEFTLNNTLDSNTNLYAKWVELTPDEIVTISFVTNVEGQTIDSVEIEKGKSLSALPVLNIDGYRLKGWFANSSYSQAFVLTTTFDTNTTIYAEYVKIFNVQFLDNDGNEITTVTVDDDTLVTEKIKKPYIEGYKFDYWYNTADNQEFDIETETITANLVLRAHYSVDTNPVAKINITGGEGFQESAYITFAEYTDADSYAVVLNGNGYTNKLLDEKQVYFIKSQGSIRAELFGLKAGDYTVKVAPVIDDNIITAAYADKEIKVEAYDRSGYAHFNNTEGVGAYNDDGTIKDNAIVLYVTNENKNTINLSFHDDVNNKDYSVTGIGNILNSAGKDNGSGVNGKGGKPNSNAGCILALAENNIPLIVRFVGCVSESGLGKPGTYSAADAGQIDGLTDYDGVDYGGSVGDNGHMARMQSGKNITFEGVGNDAIIDGWGFHLICETAHSDLAKNFEVRNLTFINTPEDAIGMEGQETESTLTITAAVERCWIHHNTFLAPSISSPAESDKSEGDGSCDFKRGRYFTCSYNYFENCHKTNLVGSGKTSVQYCLTYHHNLWYQCAARQPLARKANIHFYNNFIIGTADTVSSLRADSYMFAEKNYYLGCSRPVEYKAEGGTGVCKAYENAVIGCFNNYDATDVTDRSENAVEAPNCKDNQTGISYNHFDTNPELFYYDATNKQSDCYLTDASQARLDCVAQAGSRYRTETNQCAYSTDTNITSVASSATVSGETSLTFGKGKGVLKVFTVTTPVTVTMAATGSAGFDTGYLLKKDGSLVLELSSSDKTAVLMPGEYVVVSCVAFTPNGKNDKETTVTKCEFKAYDSEELNQQLIAQYEAAHDAIPTTVEYNDNNYKLIKAAMDAYSSLGTALQARITDYVDVTTAYNTYKELGVAFVEGEIEKIQTPVTAANSSLVSAARVAYNNLISRVSNVTISNLSKLTSAEAEMQSLGVDIFLARVADIPSTITYTTECGNAISYAEAAYEALDETQQALADVKNAYKTVTDARKTYNELEEVYGVQALITNANDLSSYAEAYDAYTGLTETQQALISGYDNFAVTYDIALIDALPATITKKDGTSITKAREIYNSISEGSRINVTNYAKLTAAENAFAELGGETLDSYSTSDFSTWKITGTTTSTTAGLTGDLYTGNTITAVSDFMLKSISKISANIYATDKGTTTFTVYTSADGESWSQVAQFKASDNTKNLDVSQNVSVAGPVYVKVVLACTKGSAKTTKLNSIAFE